MGSLSKEDTAAAIAAISAQKPDQPKRNMLQRMRNQLLGGDTSLVSYKAYATEAMINGEQPMSLQEFQKQRMPKNALVNPK